MPTYRVGENRISSMFKSTIQVIFFKEFVSLLWQYATFNPFVSVFLCQIANTGMQRRPAPAVLDVKIRNVWRKEKRFSRASYGWELGLIQNSFKAGHGSIGLT